VISSCAQLGQHLQRISSTLRYAAAHGYGLPGNCLHNEPQASRARFVGQERQFTRQEGPMVCELVARPLPFHPSGTIHHQGWARSISRTRQTGLLTSGWVVVEKYRE